jgi:replicative DNA helicase
MTKPRMLPNDLDAERGLLCSVILSPGVLNDLVGLPQEAFYFPAHSDLFELFREMGEKGRVMDFQSVKRQLEVRGKLDDIGGAEYLDEVWSFLPTAANWKYYLGSVQEQHQRRVMIWEAQKLIDLAYDPATNMKEAVNGIVEETLTRLSAQVSKPRKTNREELDELLEEIEQRCVTKDPGGIKTGIQNLDAKLLPFRVSENCVIAGATSDGKSALAAQIATHAAEQQNKVVAIFSLEMPVKSLLERNLAEMGGVEMESLARGLVTGREFPNLGAAAIRLNKILDRHLFIFEHLKKGADIVTQCRQLKAKHGLDLVIIDYLQLLTPEAKRNADRREREVAEESARFKNASGDIGFSLIALSQLNDDGKLRESRSIGHDADAVLQIIGDTDAGNPDANKNIYIVKQRRGVRNTSVPVYFHGEFMRFSPRIPSDKPNGNGNHSKNSRPPYPYKDNSTKAELTG